MAKSKSSSTRILILGLGGVGIYLAKRLVHEGYAVTAIESEGDLIRLADAAIDARLIHGNGMSLECWKEADAAKMDYMIAVTDNDAVNMLAAMIADRFGIRHKISRVRSLEFGQEGAIFGAKDLKIDLIIHPEELAAQEILRLVKRTAGNEIIDIAQGEMQLLATRIESDSPLANKTLMEIARTHDAFQFRVVAVARGITTVIPGGEHELKPQDQVFIMAARRDVPRLMALTGIRQQRRHRVMILGGGAVGSRIAELLENTVRVKIVEKDAKRAEELTFRLKHAEVLQGDGSEAGVLEMAGLLDMDTFISATGENETNIMSSLLAKHLMITRNGRTGDTQSKTISLVNKEEYLVLAATSGSDIALNKKILAGNEILKFIRHGELISVAHLHGFDAEVIELVAAPNSPITRKPLLDLPPDLHGKILVGGLFRDGKWQTAVGNTHIQANERAIVVCKSLQMRDVQNLFLG